MARETKAIHLSKRRAVALGVAAIAIVTIGLFYRYVTTGGMNARQKPSAVEAFFARHLIELGISKEARQQKNPLDENVTSADVAAGRDLYLSNCQTCHGTDGRGATSAGGGLYPPPIDLSRGALEQRNRTDGELFYLVRNGIRNTGMPGWPLSDQQIWSVVAYLRNLPETNALSGKPNEPATISSAATYLGSKACKECHADIYDRWIKTPMANVVRDPREHPDAIIPDFSKPDPLVKFTVDEVALTYGSKWKQRYFKKVGDDYFPETAQWDVTHKVWKPYFVKDDWWAPLYPPDNFQRPTGPLCDGCHSVNYDIATKKVTEWNVGCERCHGPGSEHAQHPTSTNVINAARLGYVAGNDVCIACHSQGRPINNPIDGKNYDWAVGYAVTGKLSDVWKLEDHKLGDTTFTHFADGTAHKNRMQGNDFVQSAMYTHGVTCFTCHDAHGTKYASNLRKPAGELCLDCHGPSSPNGPHAPSIAEHTHHKSDSAGSECIACHMPKIAQTIGDVNVRSHTFRFVTPSMGDTLKIPNACNVCHADKPTAWATEALRSWSERSPWRVGQ
jgi:predicted CXXCH cytochrome family protein